MTRRLLAVLTIGFLAVSPAMAQQAQTPVSPQEEKKPEDETVRREEVVVVSASKVEQTVVNAPATVSVLTSNSLALSPAQNYGDLLRSVPGMNVIQMSARDINLTSRQSTSTLSSSQLALLDGRTIYLDFFGMILWDFVPTNPSEVKQIEVIRGPASCVWGANALTGVVNIITKTPREMAGTSLILTGGTFDRNVSGTREKEKAGTSFGAQVSFAQAPSDKWAYKLSAGYYSSDPYSRPVGTIPLSFHPLDSKIRTGGATYPNFAGLPREDVPSLINKGTSQPRVDLRVDQELGGGGRLTYSAGASGTEGIVHTGNGPFDIQAFPDSYMTYGKVGYTQGGFKIAAFTNFFDAEAPNLLSVDAAGKPLQLNFKTQTYDLEAGYSKILGGRHLLSLGGNARRNNFDISIAPKSEDRTELGAYVQDEIFFNKFRLSIGGRVDKFGNLEDPVFSPRVSAMLKPAERHSIRVSYNRAFRSPSTINNYLDQTLASPVDLRPLAASCPALLPPAQAAALCPRPEAVAAPFPVTVRTIGSKLLVEQFTGRQLVFPGQTAGSVRDIKQQSVTAYEIGYTGTFGGRTTIGIALYQNDSDDDINFTVLPANFDPYTATNPPPGWVQRGLRPELLQILTLVPAQFGGPVYFPRTAATYLNLGPLRQRGVEFSIEHVFNKYVNGYANASWQDDPEVLDPDADQLKFPVGEISLAPTVRFNAGLNAEYKRFLGSVSVSKTDSAFWTDVLDARFHGFTDKYTMLNATVGLKWAKGKVTTSLKGTNLLNEEIQQHLFGDVLKRNLMGEARFNF